MVQRKKRNKAFFFKMKDDNYVELRIASSMYEENFQKDVLPGSLSKLTEPPLNIVKLNNNLYHTSNTTNFRSREEWTNLLETAVFFTGSDIILGEILVMVYEDPQTHKISTVLISGLGEFHFESLTLDHKSRFYDACKNLEKSLRKSNVRRALAITLLKTYSLLDPTVVKQALVISTPFEWDETVAGDVASTMKILTTKSPLEIGKSLLDLGFLQPHYIESTLLDVVYDDKPSVIDSNNKLVYLLGEQLEHLFDPLTEYSPEFTEILYRAPDNSPTFIDDELVREICNELLRLQENTTVQLVKFLREVVVPIRMKTLDGQIRGLTTTKLNQVFPPTIDEITRVNCILLEALKTAAPFGSFEVIKACGLTLPVFYKATMRHESALKSFNGNLRNFLFSYGNYVPPEYTEAQIDVVMKSQINLTKIKMILERLVQTKSWTPSQRISVDQNFQRAINTIDSFGKEELQSHDKRVFTASGKILTEICQNWPAVLSYGWVNRKVISVIDTTNQNNREKGVAVIFNDYIVFMRVTEQQDNGADTMNPQVSDILMNSLINENPIKYLPILDVTSWTALKNLEISAFDQNSICFYFKDGKGPASVYEIEDTSKFMRIFNKALILSKTTPFHLFRIEKFGFDVYVTAHERSSYVRESTHSSVVLFLNIKMDISLLRENEIQFGLFAKFIDEDLIQIETLTLSGDSYSSTINSTEFSTYLSDEVSNLEIKRHSVESQDFMAACLKNRSLLGTAISKSSISEPSKVSRKSSAEKSTMSSIETYSDETNLDRKLSSISSKNSNKPLPMIVHKGNFNEKQRPDVSSKKPQKKSKLRQRFSKLFSKKHGSDTENEKSSPNVNRIDFLHSEPPLSKKHREVYDMDVPELSNSDDEETFETKMSAIFDEDIEKDQNIKVLDTDARNWSMPRENSGLGSNTNSPRNLVPVSETSFPGYEKWKASDANADVKEMPKIRTLFDDNPNTRATKVSGPRAFSPRSISIVKDIPSPSGSIDEDFSSPLLKIGVEIDPDHSREYDNYFTPISTNVGFQHYETGILTNELDKFEFDSFDMDEQLPKDREVREMNLDDRSISESQKALSERTSSFKSCYDAEDLLGPLPNFLKTDDPHLTNDDSFLYLAKVVDTSFTIEDLRRSETYQSLPRSYSSLKYLASYIDTNFTIDI